MDKRAKLAVLGILSTIIIATIFIVPFLTKAQNEVSYNPSQKDDCITKACSEGTDNLNIDYQIANIGGRQYTPFCIFDPNTVEQNAFIEYYTSWEEDVPEITCTDTGTINESSGEYLQECIQTGSHTETKEGWRKLEGETTLAKQSRIYLSVTSGNCHLPFELQYDGLLSPSDITLDSSSITSYFNFALDGKAVDVIPSIKIGSDSLVMSKMAWWNMTDGWSVKKAGAGVTNPHGITTNGTDWWFVDIAANYVYHLNNTLGLMSDGFSATSAGCSAARGLCYNGTTLISVSDTNDKICLMSLTGTNLGSWSVYPSIGQSFMNSMGCNQTDIWVAEGHGGIFHFGSQGQNMSDGFSTSAVCTAVRGIVFNGTDYYIVCGDNTKESLYHFNRTGQNQTDGIGLLGYGLDEPVDMTIFPNLDYSSPLIYTDFWITDQNDNFVYHFNPNITQAANELQGDDAILQGIINSTINPASLYSSQQVYMRNVTNQMKLGRFDYVAVKGNQRWAFNYISSNESTSNRTYMVNITPVLYVWEANNLTYSQIQQQVTALINSTKI